MSAFVQKGSYIQAIEASTEAALRRLDQCVEAREPWRELFHIREAWMAAVEKSGAQASAAAQLVSVIGEHEDGVKQVLHVYEQTRRLYDELFCAAAALVESEMIASGWGPPPAAYAFVLFGSGGRKEMTPWSDQDHGVIWDMPRQQQLDGTVSEVRKTSGKSEVNVAGDVSGVSDVSESRDVGDVSVVSESSDARDASDTRDAGQHMAFATRYFMEWGTRMTNGLSTAGFPPCTGKVIASEPEWNGSMSKWLARVMDWSHLADWESMRYLSISLDMRTVYGDVELEQRWRASLTELAGRQTHLYKALVRNGMRRKRSCNAFGQLICERHGQHAGAFDFKYRSYVPFMQAIRARTWAEQLDLTAGRTERTSTMERIIALANADMRNEIRVTKSSSAAFHQQLILSWEMLLAARLLAGGQREHTGWHNAAVVDPAVLTKALRQRLKRSVLLLSRWMKESERRYDDG
ncbi:DUF294 nucleotidyltransferase-like domain-containing protein [Paenibacillus sp. 481]|uniref:DUF294 nucleotidyltransferase-like domain-containing protein n=1 Tax=Paenibacillus sp. 481 TaxID=2835869 RepID=UPI001E34D6C9|nr:DUF294 nucleotidyltransferase-like domain-containing protein [Paenibacillus sp. 481]UHA72609.1 hypothetical protein KIK04_18430 [Paenibacillus sp. 481]